MRTALVMMGMALVGCGAKGGSGGLECAPNFTLCEGEPTSINGVPTADGPVESYAPICADVEIDVDNCGACGVSCGTRGCVDGKCGPCLTKSTKYPVQPCYLDADCCSGKCRVLGSNPRGTCE